MKPKGAAGQWKGQEFQVPVTLGQGEVRAVTLDWSGLGKKEPVTYVFVGDGAPAAPLGTAPDRSGPWTPVPDTGMIPVAHKWLRVAYPRPMDTNKPSAVIRNGNLNDILAGTWEGDRVQYIYIGMETVLNPRAAQDANGLYVEWRGPLDLYRR